MGVNARLAISAARLSAGKGQGVNIASARLNFVAHQHGEDAVGFDGVVKKKTVIKFFKFHEAMAPALWSTSNKLNPAVLEVANNPFGYFLQHGHMLVGSFV
jgi:hypothetical protein